MMITGAGYISEFLKENCTMKVLDMDDNPIGDVGISQIVYALQGNTPLIELSVYNCKLSAKGTSCKWFT